MENDETKTDYDESGCKIHEKEIIVGGCERESFWDYDEQGREIYCKEIFSRSLLETDVEELKKSGDYSPELTAERTETEKFFRYDDSGKKKIWKERQASNGAIDNGDIHEYEYDEEERVICSKTIFSEGEESIWRFEYNSDGQVMKRKEIIVMAGKEVPTREITFARDENGE